MNESASLVFGPVPSRRLGRSLGVDLVPFKTCSYDCIYCQLGHTTLKTTQRREWVPLDLVLAQVEEKLASEPDYITLSGSGEPTLFSRIGELIGRIKGMTHAPVAVLTNGSLLWREAVRDGLQEADLVIPSLDAGNEEMFRYVNRPAPELSFERMMDGLVTFRQEFAAQYWLEVFVLGGVTDVNAEAEAIAAAVERIAPDRVQLNTVTRPPAEDFAYSVPLAELARLAPRIAPNAEVIADYSGVHDRPDFTARGQDVIELLRRRPCTVEDIASGLGMHRNEVVKYVEQFLAEGRLDSRKRRHRTYYAARA
jgi:wyosine [tRNA(Phe)-imidazoG37] synthetase (radical SAM superfamily)